MNKFEFSLVTDSRDRSLFWSAYRSQFGSYQRDEQEDLIKWFESGVGLLLMSTDHNDPNNWVAWAVFKTKKTVLVGYYVYGTTIDRSAQVTEIELWQRDRCLAYLAERFGNEMILLGEVTFCGTNLLHGEPGEELSYAAEMARYALTAIRLASDAPITQEEIETVIPDLDEIYGPVEDEKAAASDLENPPLADGADADDEQ